MAVPLPSTSFRRRLQALAPGWVLILYYLVAVLAGSLLLWLPAATTGPPLPYLDALFTATSAQCVTGLAVVDTGTRFTLFGQLVILTLIQLGGVGITTFSVYLFFYLRLGVGVRGRWILQETLVRTPVESLRELVRGIFLVTFVLEGLGALLLALVFVPEMGVLRGAYYAIFHSVSAFCNAGFALFPDSLVRYQGNVLVNVTVTGLIILGGIGFLVLRELRDRFRLRSVGRQRLSLHSRLVLWTTGGLLAGGTLLILLIDHRSLCLESFGKGVLIALFQSVTTRTAGFSTVDLNVLGAPTLVLMMFLMFIGASPGSAGGGIKTTSLALFVAIFTSRLRGNPHTNVCRRTVPEEVVTKVLTLVTLATLTVGIALFALLLVQTGSPWNESRGAFLDYAFEVVSALATVGLSLGVTEKLLPAGKLIIILLMFLGRVGLLTVAFALIRRSGRQAVQYSEENIMIG